MSNPSYPGHSSATDRNSIHWKKRKDQEDTISRKVAAQTTYPTTAQWYIVTAYGVIRDQEDSLESLNSLRSSPRYIKLFEVPGGPRRNNMPCQYLAFMDVEDLEISSQGLQIGKTLQVAWADPDSRGVTSSSPTLWNARVLPPLPDSAAPGNLLLLIKRPRQNTEELTVNQEISNEMTAEEKPLWLVPSDSALSARRLVNALNILHDGKSDKHKVLRRILRATDFSRIKLGSSLSGSESYPNHAREIESLQTSLSASQKAVWDQIPNSTNFIEFITGPFGTGKTTFIVYLTRCLTILGKKVLLCCSSNAAVDILAKKLNDAAPELRALRFHSMATETNAITSKSQRYKKDLAEKMKATDGDSIEQLTYTDQAMEAAGDESTKQATRDDPSEDTHDENDDSKLQTLANLIPLSIRLAKKARGSRPNFASMSLMSRCLAHAGIEGTEETNEENHREFRELFFRGDQDGIFKKEFKSLLESLQKDVIHRSSVVITTFSNSSDKLLNEQFMLDWIIGEEIGATQDVEFLIPLTSNIASVERVVAVGDAQQLAPTVLSHRKINSSGGMVNEFSENLVQPLLFRVQVAGLSISMFEECFRCNAGLHQPSSDLFYQGRVISGPGTELQNRPKSRATVTFLKERYDYETDIPRLVFDLKNGICLTGPSKSRYNLHNISHTMSLIESLVQSGIFSPGEIAIQSPYREQNRRYLYAMSKASKLQFWADKNIWGIQIMTVDSFQGGEKPCVIL